MAEEKFSDNIMRLVAAELRLANGLTVAREMFSKSYFALGVSEKITVDQTVLSMVASNWQNLTPETFAGQTLPGGAGFRAPI